uniref:Cobalt-zinc-cadmium resistance protein CzcD n=1 Tax=Globodera pallida TaxID=36090 RepID=A0A183C4N7_GLOPA
MFLFGAGAFKGQIGRCTDHHNFEHLNYFNLNINHEHNSDHNTNNHPDYDQHEHHPFNHPDHDQYKHHHFNHPDHDQYEHHHFNHCFHHQGVIIKLYRQGWQQSVPPLQSLLQPLPDMAESQMRKHLQLLLKTKIKQIER